jgi:hypothetical protein
VIPNPKVQFPYLIECIDFNLLQEEVRFHGAHYGVQPIAFVGTPGSVQSTSEIYKSA